MKSKPFIIIPAFNEERSIKDVVSSINKSFNNIVVVDDASEDNTYKLALESGAKVIKSEVNLGYDSSLQLGFEYAIGQEATSIISMDADGQHPVEFLTKMINLVENNKYEIVIATRKFLPRKSEKIFAQITNFKYSIKDITCGMKCYRASLFKKYGFKDNYNSIGTFLSLNALKNKHKFLTIEIPLKRRKGSSTFGNSLSAELKILWAIIKSIPLLL